MTSPHFHLLVVDDESMIIDSLRLLLPKHWAMTAVKDPGLVEEVLSGPKVYQAAFVDMHLSGSSKIAEGPAVVKSLSTKHPFTEIIAMSSDLSMKLMEECLENGAQKFLAKPLVQDEVIATLEKIEALWMMRQIESRGQQNALRWVGSSAVSEDLKKRIASLRGEMSPILLEGETGTGKEVIFRLLNQQEPHRAFVAVNIASISENLFESEMFGHVRGAFTGADTQKIGLCEAAHGGDLFLDEIEALPLAHQVKLLRFLESGEIRKVGAKESQFVKVRVICATNQNLSELVKQGKFREDLLFRISGQKILLPSLRKRSDDIKELVTFFLSQHRPRINKQLAPEAITVLQSYSWPGNVRELKRICEQLALTAQLPIIRGEDVKGLLEPTNIGGTEFLDLKKGLSQLVEEFEALVIGKTMKMYPSVDEATEVLKISRSSLYKKLKDYQLENPQGEN